MIYITHTHLFDSMFVILCVIAGASAHSIPNTSKQSIQRQLNNHFRTSIINIILDANPLEETSKTVRISTHENSKEKKSNTNEPEIEHTFTRSSHMELKSNIHRSIHMILCEHLRKFSTEKNFKFCLKHLNVLKSVLPQILPLARKECLRITQDQIWNCSSMDYLLSKSVTSDFTKETALVRSIFSASMMYLVVKLCSEGNQSSCGCDHRRRPMGVHNSNQSITSNFSDSSTTDFIQRDLNLDTLSNLHAGLPIRFHKSNIKIQGCQANIAFADAFTRIFTDSDDLRQLNRAQKTFNGYQHNPDPNSKDLAFIKWTKSAINLHNSNLGRQMVHEAIRTHCRCHGMSGACHFETCWDQLDFDTVTDRLRSAYLYDSTMVVATNFGSSDEVDLSLTRIPYFKEDKKTSFSPPTLPDNLMTSYRGAHSKLSNHGLATEIDRQIFKGLIYLERATDYCVSQPSIRHPGTRGRSCVPAEEKYNDDPARLKSSNDVPTGEVNSSKRLNYTTNQKNQKELRLGTCEELCCDRGYYTELVLDLVTHNCRFKFCCQVECDKRLSQRNQHYCL